MRSPISTGSILPLLLAFTTLSSAYRPTQFCKHRGENGKADMCFALNTFYNTTTLRDDIYITLQTFRFKSSPIGWAAVGLGERMMGALMFIVYGDPEAEGKTTEMQTVVRTATGHHPPLDVFDSSVYEGPIPEIEVKRSEFVPYTGQYRNTMLDLVPTHVGISEFVCYSCDVWEGFPIRNESLAQQMIWSTNSFQDFQGDFGVDRAIEMHQFGLGFGFLWVDFLNAHTITDTPWFPTIDETGEHAGMSEVQQPIGPTEEELQRGDEIERLGGELPDSKQPVPPTSTEEDEDPNVDQDQDKDEGHSDPAYGDDEDNSDEPTPPAPSPSTEPDAIIYPAPTFRGKSIRDWMWHLHGLLMSLAFLILYPLGAYFIRSSKPTAFNLHWTTQALATVALFIGAVIGYWQSHSISVAHQYVGIAIVFGVTAQIVLGALHHRRYMQVKRKTSLSAAHVWLGRSVLGAGFVNLVLGVLLRHYGRAVVVLLSATLVAEVVLLTIVLGMKTITNLALPLDQRAPTSGDEAEEYFQLVGEDDESSSDNDDDDDDHASRTNADAAKRDQARRLAKLDKV